MKNLVPFKDKCIDVHNEIVESKLDLNVRNRLRVIKSIIETEFIHYESHFTANSLELIKKNSSFNSSKEDLLSLYHSGNKLIKEVREMIKNSQVRTIISTCQNCTIDSVGNTLDHILPKTHFPQFVVNPLNLFPCCSKCNSHKKDSYSEEGEKKFLNLYLDNLPELQYLFVDIFLDKKGEFDYKFYLDNINGIDPKLFEIIKSHYTNLKLFKRMRISSIELYSEYENLVKNSLKSSSLENVLYSLNKTIEDNKRAYGANHWKYIFEKALLDSPVFIRRVQDL